jgi:hypothetical protein
VRRPLCVETDRKLVREIGRSRCHEHASGRADRRDGCRAAA